MNNDQAKALNNIAHALGKLGLADAATSMGAIEAHGIIVQEASERIAEGLHEIAAAIREHGGQGKRPERFADTTYTTDW